MGNSIANAKETTHEYILYNVIKRIANIKFSRKKKKTMKKSLRKIFINYSRLLRNERYWDDWVHDYLLRYIIHMKLLIIDVEEVINDNDADVEMKKGKSFIQWREFRIFVSHNLDSGSTNVQRLWFGFDKTRSNIRGRIFEYSVSITRLGNCICSGQSDHWFSATNRLSRALIGWFKLKLQQVQTSPPGIMMNSTKNRFFFNRRFHLKVHRNQW